MQNGVASRTTLSRLVRSLFFFASASPICCRAQARFPGAVLCSSRLKLRRLHQSEQPWLACFFHDPCRTQEGLPTAPLRPRGSNMATLLRVAAAHRPPYAIYNASAPVSKQYTGLLVELLPALLSAANISIPYEIYNAPDNEGGTLNANNTWNGTPGYICSRKESYTLLAYRSLVLGLQTSAAPAESLLSSLDIYISCC